MSNLKGMFFCRNIHIIEIGGGDVLGVQSGGHVETKNEQKTCRGCGTVQQVSPF